MPSHFEGYGLPAAEAVRLGTPTVISPDPALHEATGGAAIRMDSWTAAALTAALQRIDRSAPPGRVAGRSWLAATQDLVRELAP
jgi:glycosyltransferase involved in cell wall biosynthesis